MKSMFYKGVSRDNSEIEEFGVANNKRKKFLAVLLR